MSAITAINLTANFNKPYEHYKKTVSKYLGLNPHSKLDASKKQIFKSELASFVGANSDLLKFIGKYENLATALESRKIQDRTDLVDLIISEAEKKLGRSSPIKRQFLKENPDFAKFISVNIGGIADILNKDNGLAKIIVGKGEVSNTASINHIVNRVASQLKSDSPVTRNFLTAHPEAAIHLAQNPYELSEIRNDRGTAERFIAEIGTRSNTYNSEIFDKAEDLIDLPYLFSSTFLERHKEFAQAVVASALNGEDIKLPFFLHNNSDLIVDEISISISTSELIHAYQVSLAVNKLPSDFPLDKNFLSKNKAITTAIVGSEEFLSNLKKAKEPLNKLFGAGRTASGVDTKIINIVSRVFQPSVSRSNSQTSSTIIDIFA